MIKTSAPGSIVLFGEHAVLNGEPAIGCAVDKRLSVSLFPRQDRQITLTSALGDYEGSLDTLPDNATHRFSISILKRWRSQLSYGLDIHITSAFSHTVGLGSSSALTVALTAAIYQLLYQTIDRQNILKEALAIIQQVQGRGSGLDLATSTYGGIIHYTASSTEVIQLNNHLPLTLYYSGYKKTTPEVIKEVEHNRQQAPHLYKKLYQLMGLCTHEATKAIKNHDLTHIGWCMNYYNGLMDALGVCDKTLAEMIYTLRKQPNVHGVKISGSGLGDCVVALGKPDSHLLASQRILIDITPVGVCLESHTS